MHFDKHILYLLLNTYYVKFLVLHTYDQGWRADYAHHITSCTPSFTYSPPDLYLAECTRGELYYFKKDNKNRNDFMKTRFGPKRNVIIVKIYIILAFKPFGLEF